MMRLDGRRKANASLLVDISRASSSRFKTRPGCTTSIFLTLSVIINNFYVQCMTVLKPAAYAPWAIDIHSPLPFNGCRFNDFNGLRSLKALAACKADNRSNARSMSSPQNFDFPVCAKRSVAVFPHDLIIQYTYYV